MNQTLTESEILFFYNLLFKYEHESKAGYKDDEVEEQMGDMVQLDANYKDGDNITDEQMNCLKFSPYRKNKCWAILRHIRNAFAHGNIQSVEGDTAFLIKDYSDRSKRSKCNMLAKIDKQIFYNLISTIEEVRDKKRMRKRNRKGKSKNKSKKK